MDEFPEALGITAGMNAFLTDQTDGALYPRGDVNGDNILQVDIVGMPLHQQCNAHVLRCQSHNILRTMPGIDKVRLKARLMAKLGAKVIQSRALVQT